MTPYKKRLNENTRRIAGDMEIRNFAPSTIDAYTYHIDRFANFLGSTTIDQATPEKIRDFQLHLIQERNVGWSSFNQAVCGLRFLYRVSIPKPWPVAMIPFGKRPKRLPTVLGSDQVDQLLQCVPNLKHRTCLLTLYACGLRHIHARGGLKLEGEFADLKDAAVFEAFLEQLASVSWGLNLQPPPKVDCDSATLLKYLARYLTGGPISSERLISSDERHVKFWVRDGKINGGDRDRKCVPLRLSGAEFVRRWSLHILPKGYVRCRRYGGWSNRHRASFVAHCGQLLGNEPTETPVDRSDNDDQPDQQRCCCECGQPMALIAETVKPSWSTVMSSVHRPSWYRGSG